MRSTRKKKKKPKKTISFDERLSVLNEKELAMKEAMAEAFRNDPSYQMACLKLRMEFISYLMKGLE